ncbi:hypothetical protein BU15DRAFT_66968 [Melanogaster broomeanus]|nr:hypothetical protein BU15DRAFT_66968 [Melanogaster broomeanus]
MIGGEELREAECRSSSAPPGNPGLAFKQATPIQVVLSRMCESNLSETFEVCDHEGELPRTPLQLVVVEVLARQISKRLDDGGDGSLSGSGAAAVLNVQVSLGAVGPNMEIPPPQIPQLGNRNKHISERSWNRRMQEQQNIDVALSTKGCGASFSTADPTFYRLSLLNKLTMIAAIFHTCVNAQTTSTELVVFSREVGQAVAIAYPVSKNTGERIHADGIARYVDRRDLAWECFHALVTELPMPVRFMTDPGTGHTLAKCHHRDPAEQCGFLMDLEERRQTSFEASTYPNLYTRVLPTFASALKQPNNNRCVVAAFRACLALFPNGYSEAIPYLAGYCGHPKSSSQNAHRVATRRAAGHLHAHLALQRHSVRVQNPRRRSSRTVTMPSSGVAVHPVVVRTAGGAAGATMNDGTTPVVLSGLSKMPCCDLRWGRVLHLTKKWGC